MNKRIILYLIGLFIIIIENSITNYLNIFDTSINLLIIYICIISLYLDELEVSIISALIGFVRDTTTGAIFGINALTLFGISYSISYIREKIYKQSNVTIFTIIFISSLFDSIINLISSSFILNNYGIFDTIFKSILLIPLNNAVVGVFLFNLFKPYILKLKDE